MKYRRYGLRGGIEVVHFDQCLGVNLPNPLLRQDPRELVSTVTQPCMVELKKLSQAVGP